MDGLKKAYYRTYQQVFDIGMRCLHWRKPIVISGAGCIRQVPDVLGKCGVTKVMVVTGSHVVKSRSRTPACPTKCSVRSRPTPR